MNTEERLNALENRLQAAEDQLEIIRLLNSYGPAVDSGEAMPAAQLWVDDGVYDFGIARLVGQDNIAAMYESDGHMELVNTGVSHLTATPQITLNGDNAEAVAYSYVMLKEGDRWFIWRAAVNHWKLTRTTDGWRIVERFNRVLDGSQASHDNMRKALKK